jgi:hypothetical protein
MTKELSLETYKAMALYSSDTQIENGKKRTHSDLEYRKESTEACCSGSFGACHLGNCRRTSPQSLTLHSVPVSRDYL